MNKAKAKDKKTMVLICEGGKSGLHVSLLFKKTKKNQESEAEGWVTKAE
jgi:cellobiose-specific phosphotransferase system component IIB